jgi:spore germination cell wall hydrolase CwlJ-like protein
MPGTTTRPNNRLAGLAVFGILVIAGIVLASAYWLRTPATGPSAKPVQASTPAVPISFPEFTAPPRSEVSEQDAATAITVNAATPAMPDQIVMTRPFTFAPGTSAEDRSRARDCLAAAVYYEAAIESPQGQRAVAQVVLNRVRNPAFPNTICDVVFQGATRTTGCQFTFACDGALARHPNPVVWRRVLAIADNALAGVVEPSVGTATHYHANWVVPYWRSSLVKLSTIGTHIFYRWQGSLGSKSAFLRGYPGGETAYPQLAAAIGASSVPSDGIIPILAMAPAATKVVVPDKLPPRGELKAEPVARRLAADEARGTLIDDGGRLNLTR